MGNEDDLFLDLTTENTTDANDTGVLTDLTSGTANGTVDDTFQHLRAVDVR